MYQPYLLQLQSNTNPDRIWSRQPKKLGTILQEADLVSLSQLQLALQSQKSQFSHLRLGEILAEQGWLKSETADFFVEHWSNLIKNRERDPLGFYLQQAGLLEKEEIELILDKQRETGIRFGTVAVLQGLLKSTTLDFFLTHLFPNESIVSPFVNMYSHRERII
jgi:hypothetical protein